MFISEKEYKKLVKNMKNSQNSSKVKLPKKEFDSLAEENFFYFYLKKYIDNGYIIRCDIHSEFIILDDIPEYKIRKKKFKPDFYIENKYNEVFIIEMKGSVVKKLQRDYGLRKHIFIEKFCIPNKWTFVELKSEEWSSNPLLASEQSSIFISKEC